MPSLRKVALATTAAAALVPAMASATTYCVYKPDCTGPQEWTLQEAISDAGSDTGPVRIEVGPGVFTGNFVVPKHAASLEIVGSGPETTMLEPTAAGTPALVLHGGSVSQLGFHLPDLGGPGPSSLDLVEGASADHIRVVTPGTYPASPLRIEGGGGHLSHAYIDAGKRIAVAVGGPKGPGDATITDSFIRGGSAIFVNNAAHALVASRDRLVVSDDYQSAVVAIAGSAIVEDSLIDLRGHINNAALSAQATDQPAAAVEGHHVTVLADSAGSTGLRAIKGVYSAPTTASLFDSVLAGVALRAHGNATIAVKRVDTWPAAPDNVAGAAFTDEGSLSADPLLGTDLVPGAGSPAIDAAAPLAAGESDTDFAGSARTLDGDGNCDARPDLGALEAPAGTCVPPSPPSSPNIAPTPPALDTAAPRVTKLGIVRRRAVRFTI